MTRARLVLIAVVLLGFGLRAYRLDFQSIWTDEGLVAGLAGLSLPELVAVWSLNPQDGYSALSRLGQDMLGLAVETDIHPPLYYFLIHFWMGLPGRSEFALRFPAVFFGLLTIPLLYVAGKRFVGRKAALLACVIAALSPFYLDFSQQVRMYTLATFMALLSMYSFHRAFNDGRRLQWLTYALSTSLALYTHYFAITIMLVQALLVAAALVRGDDRSRAGLWLASSAGAGALLGPWIPFALRQVFDYQNRSLLTPDWQTVFSRTWQTFNLGVTVDPGQVGPALAAVLLVFVAGLGLVLWRDPAGRRGLAVLVLYMVLPVLVGLAIFRFKPMFHPKYFMMASPAYYLLLGAAAFGLWKNVRWVGAFAGLLLVVALGFGVNSYFFDSRFWKDDTRGVGRYLEARVTQRDLVLSDLVEPLGFYYTGDAPAYYLPGQEATAPERLARLTPGRERVFLVHYEHSYTDPQGLIPFLLERASDAAVEESFRGYTLRQYVLRPGSRFVLEQAASQRNIGFQDTLALEASLIGGEEGAGAPGAASVPSGGRLWAALEWRLDKQDGADYKASLTLIDDRGHVAAQKDSPIARGIDPTSRWLPGERARNYYVLPVFPGVPPGDYRLRLAVYASTQAGEQGAPVQYLGDAVELGKVVVGVPRRPAQFTANDMGAGVRETLGKIEGLGYTLNNRRYRPGDTVPLTLFLKATEPLGKDLQYRFELRDRGSSTRWQWESSPIYPTSKWRSGDGVRDWQDLPLSARLEAGEYRLVVSILSQAGAETEGLWDLGPVEITERQRLFAPPPLSHPLRVEMEGKVALLGYDLEGELKPGGAFNVVLYWQALSQVDESYAVFSHLLDGQNRIWAQRDGTPGGDAPTSGWLEGEVIVDRHSLEIRGDASPGEYVLEVGMYEPRSGRRLAVTMAPVQVVDQAVWLQKVTVR